MGKVWMATSPHGNFILSECLSYLCDLLFIWNHYLRYFFQIVFIQYLVFINIYMYVYESLFLFFLFNCFIISLLNLNCKAMFPKHFKCLNNGCISVFEQMDLVWALRCAAGLMLLLIPKGNTNQWKVQVKFHKLCLYPNWKLVKSLNINAWD